MAKEYSAYQKKIIERYYENRETIARQRLGELVSEIYLASGQKKLDRLWASVEKMVENLEEKDAKVWGVINARNVEGLAAYLGELGEK